MVGIMWAHNEGLDQPECMDCPINALHYVNKSI